MQSLYPTTPADLSDDDLVELYAYPQDRRWVRANFVSSVDGAAQGTDHKAATLSSRADQHVFALLRSLSDVILVGATTTRIEGYQPVEPNEVGLAIRSSQGLAPIPTLAVVSRSLRLDASLVEGGAAPTVVITTESSPADRREEVAAHAPVIVAGRDEVDFAAALEELAGHGFQRILCEGGPTLMRELVAAGCLDELCLTISPQLAAGDRLRILHGPALDRPVRLRLRHLLEEDGDLFCRYTAR